MYVIEDLQKISVTKGRSHTILFSSRILFSGPYFSLITPFGNLSLLESFILELLFDLVVIAFAAVS